MHFSLDAKENRAQMTFLRRVPDQDKDAQVIIARELT